MMNDFNHFLLGRLHRVLHRQSHQVRLYLAHMRNGVNQQISITLRTGRQLCLLLSVFALGGCVSSLLPKPAAQQTLYSLGSFTVEKNPAPLGVTPAAVSSTSAASGFISTLSTPSTPSTQGTRAGTLIINPTRAAPGFDTPFIAYQRRAHEIDYFSESRWVEPPAAMLSPLIANAIERGNTFAAVVRAPTSASASFSLDTEIIRLQHEFTTQPSRVRFTLNAVLIDTTTRRVVASRNFDTTVVSDTEDAQGGVIAAEAAVQRVLSELALFCDEASKR